MTLINSHTKAKQHVIRSNRKSLEGRQSNESYRSVQVRSRSSVTANSGAKGRDDPNHNENQRCQLKPHGRCDSSNQRVEYEFRR